MASKKIQIDGMTFGIADDKAQEVADAVKRALTDAEVEAVEVLDADDRRVTLYINGRAAGAVMIDLDTGPRPHQIG